MLLNDNMYMLIYNHLKYQNKDQLYMIQYKMKDQKQLHMEQILNLLMHFDMLFVQLIHSREEEEEKKNEIFHFNITYSRKKTTRCCL
jgi:hypothetical protein